MSKLQNRSAAAELVRLAGNIIYLLFLMTVVIVFAPIIIGVLIYRRHQYEK